MVQSSNFIFFAFLTSLILFYTPSNAQKFCQPNQFRRNGTCTSCPAGTYLGILGGCSKCFSGAFRATPGASDPSQCIPCSKGTFQDEEGATSCKKCPSGTFSEDFSSQCSGSCPPGTEFFGGCFKCSPGFFKPGHNFEKCRRCPSGTFTDGNGASSCKKCPKGTFKANSPFDFNPISVFVSNGCNECQPGSFGDEEGLKFCKLCRPGTISDQGATKCTPCPKGMFSSSPLKKRCKKCPKGSSTRTAGAAACKRAGQKCPSGTFLGFDGSCKACLPGERYDVNKKSCVACKDDEISGGGVDTKCRNCPPTKMPISGASLYERSGCVCKVGTVDDGLGGCVACPAGTFWENDNGFFLTVGGFNRRIPGELDIVGTCERCDPGTFTNKAGMLGCEKCPENTYQDRLGSTSCMKCPPGFGSLTSRDNDRTKCVDKDLVCGPREKRGKGSCTTATCCKAVTCRKDQYMFKTFCNSCLTGRFDKKLNQCFPCPVGQKSVIQKNGGLPTKCAPCGKNKAVDSELFFDCICAEGFGEDKEGSCVRCKPFQISRRFPNGKGGIVRRCVSCQDGQVANRRRFCNDCRPGSITLTNEATKCVACPAGTKQVRNIYGERRNECREVNN